jgi:hypothetical protein
MVRRVLRRVTDAFGAGEGRAGVAGRLIVDCRQNHRHSAGSAVFTDSLFVDAAWVKIDFSVTTAADVCSSDAAKIIY